MEELGHIKCKSTGNTVRRSCLGQWGGSWMLCSVEKRSRKCPLSSLSEAILANGKLAIASCFVGSVFFLPANSSPDHRLYGSCATRRPKDDEDGICCDRSTSWPCDGTALYVTHPGRGLHSCVLLAMELPDRHPDTKMALGQLRVPADSMAISTNWVDKQVDIYLGKAAGTCPM